MGIGVKSKVTFKDMGWKKLRRHMIEIAAKDAHVKVGVLADSKHGDDAIGMLELAAIHELGSPAAGIPERSFIRSTFHREEDALREFTERVVKKLYEGQISTGKALGLIGQWGVSAIKRTIRQRLTEGPEPQELKPATIAAKGSSTPLLDHGLLLNAVSYQVEGVDEGEASESTSETTETAESESEPEVD